MHTTQTIWID